MTKEKEYEWFVSATVKYCNEYKGNRARLKRADNPSTEYQAWEFLISKNINIADDAERVAYLTIVAAIAKSKINENGNMGIGRAIAKCYSSVEDSGAKLKLNRLLATNSVQELCDYLRSLLAFIDANNIKLDYAKLLSDIMRFRFNDSNDQNQIKSEWAMEYYREDYKPNAQSNDITSEDQK